MNKTLLHEFDNYLKKHKNEIVEDIFSLVKIPSVKSAAKPNAPYGDMCSKALKTAAKMFKNHGYAPEIKSEGRYATVKIGNAEKTIGIFGHSDVVPAGDGWLYTQPFAPVLKNGAMIGRGVNDNKSGVAMSLHIPLMFERLGIKLKSSILVFIGSNEESGMDDIKHFVSENKMPDVSIVPDGGFPISIGEKGICRFNAVCSSKFKDIVSFSGGEAYNIILDKVKAKINHSSEFYNELTDIASNNNNISVRQENNFIHVTASGTAKHAAHPEGGVNAAYVFASALSQCRSLCENDKKILNDIKLMTEKFYGEAFSISSNDENFGPLTCINSICSIKDDSPVLGFDVRYGNIITANELENALDSALCSLGWNLKILENKPSYTVSEKKFISVLENVYSEISEDKNARAFYSSGGTYARCLKNAFSTGTEVNYISGGPEMPQGHGSVHQCDESLFTDSYLEAVKITAMMIIECDNLLNN